MRFCLCVFLVYLYVRLFVRLFCFVGCSFFRLSMHLLCMSLIVCLFVGVFDRECLLMRSFVCVVVCLCVCVLSFLLRVCL